MSGMTKNKTKVISKGSKTFLPLYIFQYYLIKYVGGQYASNKKEKCKLIICYCTNNKCIIIFCLMRGWTMKLHYLAYIHVELK